MSDHPRIETDIEVLGLSLESDGTHLVMRHRETGVTYFVPGESGVPGRREPEPDRFREHSITLNRVAYGMAEALGRARDGEPVMANIDELLRALIADRDRFRLLFMTLLMRGAEIGEVSGSYRLVKIPVADVQRAQGFALWEWPMIEFSFDFAVYRKGEEPK